MRAGLPFLAVRWERMDVCDESSASVAKSKRRMSAWREKAARGGRIKAEIQ
jgi:hypothetical protein